MVLFSWPSFTEHPHGETEAQQEAYAYRNARNAAELSGSVFDAFLQLFSEISGSRTSVPRHTLNLFAHSMGNYLLQNYVESAAFNGLESKVLTNVVLSQADVDSENHHAWVANLRAGGPSVFVTINRKDAKLQKAEAGLGSKRLGNTPPSNVETGITYVDFTNGEHVNDSHALWRDAVMNAAVTEFFAAALNGKRVLDLTDTRWHCHLLALCRPEVGSTEIGG